MAHIDRAAAVIASLGLLALVGGEARAESPVRPSWRMSAPAPQVSAEGPAPVSDHGYGGFSLFSPLLVGSGAASGAGAGFRVHGAPALSIEVSLSRLIGHDQRGRQLGETPLWVTGSFYGWHGTVQPFATVGLGHGWATLREGGGEVDARRWMLGAGVGMEVFVTPRASAFFEARALTLGPFSRDEEGGGIGFVLLVGGAAYVLGR